MFSNLKIIISGIISFLGFIIYGYIKLLKKENNEIQAKNERLNEENSNLKEYQKDYEKKSDFENELQNKIDKINKDYEAKKENINDKIDNTKDDVTYKVEI